MQDQIKNMKSLEELQALYASVFGKNGTMTLRLREMSKLEPGERASLNKENTELRELFKRKQTEIEQTVLAEKLSKEYIDVTLDCMPENHGTLHPLTQSLREIGAIMESLGFEMWTGPEIEDDWHNFTALNTPSYHPARDMQDTFFLGNGNVLRTQTSAIQIRAMETQGVPIKMFAVGRTYRKEMDATHSPMFGQIEALYVDKIDAHITMSDLVATLRTLLECFLEKKIEMRIRPSYFPFTEPSVEIDIKWNGGKWLEVCGAGMVHPNVLKNCGIDPTKYQGFAFGFGWDRMAMLKYGLNDIRAFYNGDVRWLKNNGFNNI